MNAFLVYLLKGSVLLSVFLAFFLLVMRRSEHFRLNRVALLAGSALCLLLPLVRFRVNRPTLYSEWLEPVAVSAGEGAGRAAVTAAGGLTLSWPVFLLFVYLVGALVTSGFFVYSYGRMFRLLRHTPAVRRDGYSLHLLDRDMPSFSWLRHIVLSRGDYARYPAILTHEKAHVRCGHSYDLLLASVLAVFQWFNPLVWLCRSELKLLHEYEADDFVLNKGIDATQYQLLLVKKAVGEKRFLLANGFNHAQLKNRITMMQTQSRAAWKKLLPLLLIPLFAGTMLLLAECKPDAVPFQLVDVKPQFQDGDADSFAVWVNRNLTYPETAREKELEGRVTLQFTVEPDGSVTGVKVLRGVDPILDDEAVRVISQSPRWSPGLMNGKPVRVTYNFPVVFQLK